MHAAVFLCAGGCAFFFFFRLGLQTSVSVCRLLLQPLSSLPASPGLFPTAEGSGTRPQQREANYLQVHPLKKKKSWHSHTQIPPQAATHNVLRPARRSYWEWPRRRTGGAKWIVDDFIFIFFIFLFSVGFILLSWNQKYFQTLTEQVSGLNLCVLFYWDALSAPVYPWTKKCTGARLFNNHSMRRLRCMDRVWPDFWRNKRVFDYWMY